jgi:hypothetical protein
MCTSGWPQYIVIVSGTTMVGPRRGDGLSGRDNRAEAAAREAAREGRGSGAPGWIEARAKAEACTAGSRARWEQGLEAQRDTRPLPLRRGTTIISVLSPGQKPVQVDGSARLGSRAVTKHTLSHPPGVTNRSSTAAAPPRHRGSHLPQTRERADSRYSSPAERLPDVFAPARASHGRGASSQGSGTHEHLPEACQSF